LNNYQALKLTFIRAMFSNLEKLKRLNEIIRFYMVSSRPRGGVDICSSGVEGAANRQQLSELHSLLVAQCDAIGLPVGSLRAQAA
jgi:hypothetical protein